MSRDRFLELAPDPRPLKEGEKYTVFLSYRSINRSWVINLYDVLRMAGHTVFLDQAELVPGSSLQRSLEDALQASQSGVLIWSEAAAESEWVRDEYEVLRGRMRREDDFFFVPLRLDTTPLPAFANNQVFLSFSGYPDGPNGGELLRLLHGVVGCALSDEAMRFAQELDEAATESEAEIAAATMGGNGDHLVEIFDKGGIAWDIAPTLGARTIEALARLGRQDDAIDRAAALSDSFQKSIRPKQMWAHVLTRRGNDGDLAKAQMILGKLYAANERDPETLGLYARTFMDQYSETGKEALLRMSRDLYAEGFNLSRDDTYCGINAAAKSVFLKTPEDTEQAAKFASQVAEILPKEIEGGMDYWDAATIAEVALIRKEFENAERFYSQAVALAPNEHGSHQSSFDQAKRLLEAMNADPEWIRKIAAVFNIDEGKSVCD